MLYIKLYYLIVNYISLTYLTVLRCLNENRVVKYPTDY